MRSGNARGTSRTKNPVSRKGSRDVRSRSACAAASSSVVRPIFDQLESRMMLTIVQGVGADYVAWEAEEPNAIIRDTDNDGRNWRRVGTNITNYTISPDTTAVPNADPGHPVAEGPAQAIDDAAGTKYLNFGGNDRPVGLIITLPNDQVIDAIKFTLANDASERDPITYVLEGSTSASPTPSDASFVPISSGMTGFGDVGEPQVQGGADIYPRGLSNTVTFANTTAYRSYRVTFPHLRNIGAANSMQIADVILQVGNIPIGTSGNGATAVAIHATDNLRSVRGGGQGLATSPSGGQVLYADDTNEPGSMVTYAINFDSPGTYKVYTRRQIPTVSGANNSMAPWTAIDQDHALTSAPRFNYDDDAVAWDVGTSTSPSAPGEYIWTSDGLLSGAGVTVNIPSAGLHTISFAIRELGYMLDRVVFSKNTALTSAELDALANAESVRTQPLAATLNPANAGNGGVQLTWTGGTGMSAYQIKRASAPGGPYTVLATQVGSSYVDSTVTNEQTYYYVITAINDIGGPPALEATSNEVSATPSAAIPPVAPTNVAVAPTGYDKATVTWTAPLFATRFNVKRADTAGGPYTTVAANVTGTSFVDTLPAGTTIGEDFYYVVSAVSPSDLEGANSAEARLFAASGLRATVYASANLTDNPSNANDPLTVFHPTVNFNFGTNSPLGANDTRIPVDNFSVAWEAVFIPSVTANYKFFVATDDGGRLFVNGEKVFDVWRGQGETERGTASFVPLTAGVPYHIRMEQNDTGGGSAARLRYEGRDNAGTVVVNKGIIPTSVLRLPALDQPHLNWVRASDFGKVTVSWSAPGGAGPFTYTVKRADSTGGPLTTVASGLTGTSFVDSLPAGTAKGEDFYYVVTATSGGVEGPATPEAKVYADAGLAGYYYNTGFWGGGGRPADPNKVVIGPTATVGPILNPSVQFDWGTNAPSRETYYGNPGAAAATIPGIPGDNHSTAFVGMVRTNEAGQYTFVGRGDDDTHVYVNGQLVSSDPGGHGVPAPDLGGYNTILARAGGSITPVTLAANTLYPIVIIQAEGGGGSGVFLDWITPTHQSATLPIITSVPPQNLLATMTAPIAATSVTATQFGTPSNRIIVNFTDASTSETGYLLERSVNGGAWTVVGVGPMLSGPAGGSPAGEMIDAGAPTNATSIQYRVVGVNPYGRGTPSAPVSLAAIPTLGNDPENVTIYAYNHRFWQGREPANLNSQQENEIVLGRAADFSGLIGDLNENWGTSPDPSITADNFSTLFTGKVRFPEAGEYRMALVGDDHTWLWTNGVLRAADNDPHGTPNLNDPGGLASVNIIRPFTVAAGDTHTFLGLQAEQGGGAAAQLWWLRPGQTTWELVPTSVANPDPLLPPIVVLSSPTNVPTAPTGLAASNITASVLTLNWTDTTTDELRYSVQRAPNSGPGANQFVEIAVLPPNATTFTDGGLTPNTAYTYRVVAENFIGIGQAQVAATTIANEPPPADPTGLAAYSLGKVNQLFFTDNAFNETGYVVERKPAGAPDSAFAAIPGSPFVVNAFGVTGQVSIIDSDPALVADAPYTYRISAVNSENEPSASLTANTTIAGANVTYFSTRFFTGPSVARRDGTINFDFGTGAPAPGISADNFTAAWSATFTAPEAGNYIFYPTSDDGVLLFVDGQLVVDQWVDRGPTENAAPVTLTAGPHEIQMLFYENGGGALAQLRVEGPNLPKQIVPASMLTPPQPTFPLRQAIRVTATNPKTDSIRVTWFDVSTTETGYEIWRSTDGAAAVKVGQVGKDQGQFWDLNTALGATYTYQVRPMQGATAGPFSDPTAAVSISGTSAGAFNAPTGFNNALAGQWTLNSRGDDAVGSTMFVDGNNDGEVDRLQMTRKNNGHWGSAYLTDTRHVEGFSTSFDFQLSEGSGNPADGFTFIIQANDTAQVGGGGGALGWVGILNSVAIKFDTYSNLNQVGLYTNGAGISDDPNDPRNRDVPTDRFDFIPANGTGPVLNATITYDPVTDVLKLKIDDKNNPGTAPFETSWTIDIASTIGSSSAWVGFTAATGGENMRHDILNFTFDPNPPVTRKPGDADGDGDVDGVDISRWGLNFTGSLAAGTGGKTVEQGDFDGDGDVDGNDAAIWGVNFTGDLGGGGLTASAPVAAALLPAATTPSTLATPITTPTTTPTKPALLPAAKPTARPVVKPAATPVVKPAAKPALKPAARPAKPAARPAAKPAVPAGKVSPVGSLFSSTKIGAKSSVLGQTDGKVI